jgi:uncharacterized repeat protein (TIGR03803 family)
MKGVGWTNDLIDNVDIEGAWTGDAGPSTGVDAIPFNAGAAFADAVFPSGDPMAKSPKLTTLVNFTGADGKDPNSSLIADAAGNLFGTTYEGGADNRGTVFEIAKTKGGYASAPITLVSFTGADGEFPEGSLIADAAGNLFGTTDQGGADNLGTVFEIAKTKSGYASAPTTLVSFTGADGTTGSDGSQPVGGLITDAAGDLFGTTTAYFHDGFGTVFEVAKTQDGYASKPTTLATFNGPDGAEPGGRLIADSQGDLFGTT